MIFLKEDGAICLNDGEDVVVFPLLKDELKLLLEDKNYFENYLNLKYEGEPIENMKETFSSQLKRQTEDPDNWVFHAVWVVASIKYRAIVGSLVIKDVPDSLGRLDIGYIVARPYRRQGIMTSAVSLICDWAFDNNILSVTACVKEDNTPAIRVLEKNDFVITKHEKEMIYFQKDRK